MYARNNASVLVSFIVPVYNGVKYVSGLISDFQQLDFDFELLIGDDCSTDKTLDVISAFLSDPRIKLIKSEKNLGAGAMRNLLLKRASGQFIAIHDADDLFDADKFSKQLKILQEDRADVVGTGMYLIDGQKSVYQTIIPPEQPSYLDWIMQRSMVHASIMFKNIFLDKAKYHDSLKYGEDYYFLTQLYLAGARFYNIQEPLYYYRIEASNIKQRARKLFFELIKAKAEISKLFSFPHNFIFFAINILKLFFSYWRSFFFNEETNCKDLISVLLPVYNGEKYIVSAINSVLSQSYSRLELLVINDCSTDNSEQLILSINDSRIKYIKNDKNLGIAESLNVGLRLAKGQYIARMDQDDLCVKNRLQKQIQFFYQCPDIDIIGTSFYLIDEKSMIINASFRLSHDEDLARVVLARRCIFAHPTVMLRRKIIDENNFYSSNFLFAEDYELWLRIVSKYKMRNLTERLLYYRVHSMSATKKHNRVAINSMMDALSLHNPLNLDHVNKKQIINNIKRPQDINSLEDYITTVKAWVISNQKYRDIYLYSADFKIQHSVRVYEFIFVSLFYCLKKFHKFPISVIFFANMKFKLNPIVFTLVSVELIRVVAYYTIIPLFYYVLPIRALTKRENTL